MIYEFRTYDLRTGKVTDYHKAFAEKIDRRMKYSKMAGHWYTEVGPLNQMVAIWPYDSLEQRIEVRREVEAADGGSVWPPQSGNVITGMKSEIYFPAPFMAPMDPRKIGPMYEMRIYSYPPEVIPAVLDAFADAVAEREKLSPMAGCWYSDFGGVNNFVSMWAYSSFEERLRVRKDAQDRGVWPPPKAPMPPSAQVTKILWPATFSPMQ